MDTQWSYQCGMGLTPAEVSRHLLAIVGPSGAGKTALTAALQKHGDVFVPPIYTTRERRDDDLANHYRYVAEDEFLAMEAAGQFLLCRRSPFPQYGWPFREIRLAINAKKTVTMLFRNDGLEVLLDLVASMSVVFLDPSPAIADARSRGRLKLLNENAQTTGEKNRHLQDRVVAKGWPMKCLTNEYKGIIELERHAATLIDWSRAIRSVRPDD